MFTLSNDIWLKVGGAFSQGGKKFAAQISLLLNFMLKNALLDCYVLFEWNAIWLVT